MSSGELSCTMDKENRIPIPTKFLKKLGEVEAGVIVVKGLDKCLCLFPANGLREIKKMFGGIPSLEMIQIKSGKISISVDLKEYAGLKKEVVFAHCDNYFEIWDKQRWTGKKEEISRDRAAAFNGEKL